MYNIWSDVGFVGETFAWKFLKGDDVPFESSSAMKFS